MYTRRSSLDGHRDRSSSHLSTDPRPPPLLSPPCVTGAAVRSARDVQHEPVDGAREDGGDGSLPVHPIGDQATIAGGGSGGAGEKEQPLVTVCHSLLNWGPELADHDAHNNEVS